MEEYLTRNKKRRAPKPDIEKLAADHEKDIAELRERMFALREENRLQREELERCRENEKYITTLLLNAQKAAERIVAEGEMAAAKKLYAAQEQEKRLRELIASYMDRLTQIETQTAKLMSEIVETVSGIKEGKKESAVMSARELFLSVTGTTDDVA